MNGIAKIGDNNPPDTVQELLEKHAGTIGEVENWLDGAEVENESQMIAVDYLIKSVKVIEKEAKTEKDSEYRPHKDGCDRVVAKWKSPLVEFASLRTGLLAIVGPYKQKLADEKEAVKRKAYDEAREAERIAKKAAADADMKNIDERRAADKLASEATELSMAAQDARDDKVLGLRKTYTPEITDYKALINWIVTNDKQAAVDWMDDYVAKAVRGGARNIGGVSVHEEKRVF